MAYQFEKSGLLKPPTAEQLLKADQNSYIIVCDKGILEDNTPYWVYLAVIPSKYKKFVAVTKAHQPMRLTDYGEILKYGFDEEVPAEIEEEMAREHGCNKNFLAELANEITAGQILFLKEQENQRLGDIVAMLQKKKSNN